ncbi:carboxypeptidase M32 [Nemorincola caseinilytica]|uniref:Metal-dependent carboxypeptidase n=1 Tax=Nemorincola caseinilytica TaxID=2054315 RepID=A0ABP8N412_9BACT
MYEEYVQLLQKAADINNAAAVLGWDQETYMPPKGAAFRGRQLATLASLSHELVTSPRMSELLAQLRTDKGLDELQKANVLRSNEDHDKNSKLPPAFVEELSLLTSECFNAWIEARRQNDFGIFAPSLTKMVALKRRQAELYGYKAHPYDALVDEYEPGANVAMLDRLFDGIKQQLPPILATIKAAPQVNDDLFYRHYPRQQQWDFSVAVLKTMGYDMEAGRQDISEHPFSTSFAPTDVRVTTRVDEHNYASLLWSTIHEGGHALYEQGLPEEQYGLPLGAAASLGIHESQSRLWENCVGRSEAFWQYFYPQLQAVFPQQLADVTATDLYKACNKVEPSLIRTEADEVTYHFHVLIRYEIEKQLIEGTLQVADLPAAWNEAYQKYLGITPPDHKTGVLQDVHWSHGSFGYFPTYTLGSFYAAQFYIKAQEAIPTLLTDIAAGKTSDLLAWLRTNIHRHGRRYYSDELCELVTGKRLDPTYFLNYIKQKYTGIYGVRF